MSKVNFKQAKISNVTFGNNVSIIRPVNLYDCQLEDDSFVGPFVEIQKGVLIGKRTRVQSHSFICELVTIGSDCFIGHGVIFVNDLFKEGGPSHREDWKATIIGNRVSIGSNATILPVHICDDVVVGAASVVTKDIDKPGVYAGNPAKLIRYLPPAQ